MPEVKLPYGHTNFLLDTDKLNVLEIVSQNKMDFSGHSPREVVEKALANPIDSPTLPELIHKGDKICVLVPDVTRIWQSPAVSVPIMIAAINRCGIPDSDITILCATGTHRRMSEAEHEHLLGREIIHRLKVVDHQSMEKSEMRKIGVTSRGTHVWLNRHAVEADKIISVCGVAYHFLAGFGGGGKMLVPGIASDETIQANHRLALLPGIGHGRNPEVRSGNYSESNPFHADIFEAAAMLAPIFSLNVVVDDVFNIVAAYSGNWRKAHARACELVREMEAVPIRAKADLVIASAGGAPKDINLYQGIKVTVNAVEAALPGATLILLAQCPEGFGNDDTRRLLCDYRTMHEREQSLRDKFSIGAFVGYFFAECSERFDLILVTQMQQEEFGNTRIHAVGSLAEALELAKNRLTDPCIIMPHGATTFPVIRKG